MLLIGLSFAGSLAFFVVLVMWEILKLVLCREEWEAMPNRLTVRRGMIGFLRSRELSGAERLLEPHFKRSKPGQQWRLAAVCDEKHYLLRGQTAPIGTRSAADIYAEAAAIATLLATHTGWHVSRSEITIDASSKPPADSDEEELLVALRTHGFGTDVDVQGRLTIRPPKLPLRIVGLVALAMGIAWLREMVDPVNSYLNEENAGQDILPQIGFWVLMTPMVMVGFALCAFGIAIIFGRERWIADRNQLLIQSRLFGWESEREFVNARWRLVQALQTRRNGRSHTLWKLELENASGQSLKVLRLDRDDDISRLLGTLLSQRTGWPLLDENVIKTHTLS